MYWRHIVASSIPGGSTPTDPGQATSQPTSASAAAAPGGVRLGREEQAGSARYQERHYAQVLQQGLSFSGFERDHLFLNSSARAGHVAFEEVSLVSGADSDTDGRAVIVEDLDDDGDDDLVVTTLQRRRFQVFRNERVGGAAHGFIKLRLRAKGANTRGIGALVTVRGERTTVRPRTAGGGFSSQRGEWMTFGTGTSDTVDVDVLWPGGARTTYAALATRARYLLTQGRPEATDVAAATFALPDPPQPGLSGITLRPGAAPPPLPLTDVAGVTAPWAPSTEGPTVLHLWATWCKSCQEELPELAQLRVRLRASHPDAHLQTVSMEPGEQARVAAYLEKRGIELPLKVGDPDALPALVSGDGMLLPTTLIFDREGRLAEGLQSTLAVAGISDALDRLK